MWMKFIAMLGVTLVDIVTTKLKPGPIWRDMSRIPMTKLRNLSVANVTTEMEDNHSLRNMWMLFITTLGLSPVDIVTTKHITGKT